MLEVAAAACQEGTAARDTAAVNAAIAMAGEALATGVAYASDRVIDRTWRFRRRYSGPVTSQVREFDEQLRAAVA